MYIDPFNPKVFPTVDGFRRHHFGKYGALADIALMKDKYTGHPRGFGFMKFEDLSGGQSNCIGEKFLCLDRLILDSEPT